MAALALLPRGFGFVGAAILSTVFLQVWQTQIVVEKRKKAGIEYPQVYATAEQEKLSRDALIFNCAQRAHQNTLELINNVWIATIIAGFAYPLFAASACALWTFERVLYTRGYVTGDTKKRITPIHHVSVAGLIGNMIASTFVVVSCVVRDLDLNFNLKLL